MTIITPPAIKARVFLGGDDARFDTETGIGTIRYIPTDGLMNPAGTVLGGYLAAMLDDVAGLATWYGCGERMFATTQMSTSFLRGAKINDVLVAEAVASGTGKRQAFVDATLKRESDGKVVAKATLVQTFIDS